MILNTHISLAGGKGLDATPVWDRQGSNWAAVIVPDGRGGYKRAQQFRAGEGTCRLTLPPEGLAIGDAVIFCAESADGMTRTTWYGFVKFLNDVGLVLCQAKDGVEAIKEGEEYRKNTRLDDAILRHSESLGPSNPLFLVNSILESNALRICNLAIESGQLPPLQSGLDRVVLGRDVPAGMSLVAGYGALAVGLMWIQDERAASLPGFNDALKIQYLKE